MATFQGIELKMMKFTINPQNENRYNNVKVIKFYDNVQPFVLVKNNIINNSDLLSWNNRQLVEFDFETNLGLTGNGIGKIIAQLSNDVFVNDSNIDFSSYTVFKILKIKKIGNSEISKNIQEQIDNYDSNGNVSGTQLEDINVSKDSFDPTITSMTINFINTGLYFVFGFKCTSTKSLIYNTNETSSINHTFENMIYIFNNNFTTGFSSAATESTMKIKLLMNNTDTVEIVNTSPSASYNILFNNDSSNIINIGTSSIITFFIQIINGVTNSKINLRFLSDDIIFNTFVPIFKQVGTNQYLLSSRPSGLNPDLYVFNVSVFKISAVDKITRSTTSVISLNGNRDIEFFIEPDLKQEYFGGLNPLVQPLKIIITN